MKSNKEFLEEVYSRGERYKAAKRKQRKAILLSIIPIAVCGAIIATAVITPAKKGVSKAPAESDETVVYTGDYEELEGTDDIAEDIASEAEDIEIEDTYDDTVSSQIHYPNQQIDGDYSATDKSNTVAKSETASAPASQSSRAASTNDLRSSQKNDDSSASNFLIDADDFTVINSETATHVTDEKMVDIMEAFLLAAAKNPTDHSYKCVEILTIEMGGMKFKLRNNLLCNETLNENYELDSIHLTLLHNILTECNISTEEIESLLDSDTEETSAVADGAASESAYLGE